YPVVRQRIFGRPEARGENDRFVSAGGDLHVFRQVGDHGFQLPALVVAEGDGPAVVESRFGSRIAVRHDGGGQRRQVGRRGGEEVAVRIHLLIDFFSEL